MGKHVSNIYYSLDVGLIYNRIAIIRKYQLEIKSELQDRKQTETSLTEPRRVYNLKQV